jgi:hypothetical protein
LISPPRADVRDVMAISTLILQLSTQRESFGRTVIEALSLCRPVLGYAHGGVGELLTDLYPMGRVPPGDRARLAERAAELMRAAPAIQPLTRYRLSTCRCRSPCMPSTQQAASPTQRSMSELRRGELAALLVVLGVLVLLPIGRSSELPILIGAVGGLVLILRHRMAPLIDPGVRLAVLLFVCYWLPIVVSGVAAVAPAKTDDGARQPAFPAVCAVRCGPCANRRSGHRLYLRSRWLPDSG